MKPQRIQFGILAALLLAGCHSAMTPPPQLSPVGQIAFYSVRLTQALEALKTVAVDGEKAGAVSREDAQTILGVVIETAQANADLDSALQAGDNAIDAKHKAVAIIGAALQNLPSHLSPNAAALVQPYIQTALTLLTVFQS